MKQAPNRRDSRLAGIVVSIRRSVSERGYPPTLSELASEHGVTPPQIQKDLEELEARSLIVREPGVARGIRLTTREERRADQRERKASK